MIILHNFHRIHNVCCMENICLEDNQLEHIFLIAFDVSEICNVYQKVNIW